MWSDLFSALIAMDFQQASKILSDMDAIATFMNPWVIAVMVIISIVLLIRHGERGVITFLSVPAFLVLFQKTVQGMDVMKLEHSSQNLLIFIGGFLVIAAVNVYFHFVR
jgi:hypothetical protein